MKEKDSHFGLFYTKQKSKTKTKQINSYKDFVLPKERKNEELMKERKTSLAEIIRILDEEVESDTKHLAILVSKIAGITKAEAYQAIIHFRNIY